MNALESPRCGFVGSEIHSGGRHLSHEYARLPEAADGVAVAGSWMVRSTLISSEAFGEITRLAAEAVGVVRIARTAGEAP